MTEPEPEDPENKQQQPSFSTRRLESFSAPDLEVLVGKKDRIYRYHAVILACHSGFVDRALSSPMGARNQEEKRIDFTDIEEDTWEKMISFLEPGGFQNIVVEDIEQVLPFYEKYLFMDGLKLMDDWISRAYSLDYERYNVSPIVRPEVFVIVGVMAYNMALSLPKASKAVVIWATEVLEKMTAKDEKTIQQLLPLVENDEKLLQNLVKLVKGRHYRTMRVDEMRSLTRADTFAKDILLKTKQIEDLEEAMKYLRVDTLTIRSDNFTARLKKAQTSMGRAPDRGAMRFVYKGKNQNMPEVFYELEGMDPSGLVWEISTVPEGTNSEADSAPEDNDEDVTAMRSVLFRWDCGYTSLFPPKHGWHAVEATTEGSELEVDYMLENKASHLY